VEGPVSVSLVALRCRTSDRTPAAVRGVDALAPALGERLGVQPRYIGSAGEPAARAYAEDLRDSRGCLLEAGGQVEDALTGSNVPVLVAPECSIALTTLPAALAQRPETVVLWLDAHGDFNTPETTTSEYLGGMSLSGACGLWDAGLGGGAVDTARVVLAGVRELDTRERELLERSDVTVIGASVIETLVAVKNALADSPVYVHLDLDVLDPEQFPAQFPAPGGLGADKLYDLFESVAEDCELVGLEVTAFEAPDDAAERARDVEIALEVLEPLLQAIPEEARVRD
jgi:arginase family enzyme